jgi:hypothetical protein
MLGAFALATALLVPAPLSKSSSPHTHLSSRRSVLGGAAAASGAAAALALLPTSPAFAASSGVYKPAAGSLEGTTIFITGANTGLGLESAKRLAAAGGSVVVSARTQAKAEQAAKEVGGKTIGIELDLADLRSVKSLPARLEAALGGTPTIDVLMNNAGVMAVRERVSTWLGVTAWSGYTTWIHPSPNSHGHPHPHPYQVPERVSTTDGFEKTVSVNPNPNPNPNPIPIPNPTTTTTP